MAAFVAPFRLRANSQITSRLRRRSQANAATSMMVAARPIHIALVTETAEPEINGVANTISHLIRGLSRNGYRITLFRPDRPGINLRCRSDHQVVTLPGLPIPGYPELRFGLPARGRLIDCWSIDTPDLVHVATEGPLGASAISAARDLGLPVTSSFHTHFEHYCDHYRLGWIKRHVENHLRRLHNRTDLTLAPTRALADALTASGFRNVDVLGRGIDDTLFRPERRDGALRALWGLGADDLAVIYVGRIAAEKNLELLFDAFAPIRQAHPSARLILVGDGPKLETLRHAHPDAIFVGMKTGVELASHYASGDLFLFPSLTETYGNVIVEAMASGLAVAAFDRGAAREWIRDRDNGLAVSLAGGDADGDFIAAGLDLANDAALRNRLRQQAAAVATLASWSSVAAQFASHLDRCYQRHIRRLSYRTRLSYLVE